MKPWTFLDKLVWGVARWATGFAVRPLKFLGITPNQLTIYSAVINFSLAAFSFAHGTYYWNLIGLFFLLVHAYFDFADGTLARATGQTSKLGSWLDPRLDVIGAELVVLSIAFGLVRFNPSLFWLIIVFVAILGRLGILALVFDYYYGDIYNGPKFLDKFRKTPKITIFDKIIKEFITLESFPFLFFGTFRYFLPVMIIFDKLNWFLLIVGIFDNIRWLIMFWAYALVHREQKSNFKVINLLGEYFKT